MTPELVQIPPEQVEDVWPLCDQFITDATYRTEVSPADLRQQCIDHDCQLWFAWGETLEAAAITTVWLVPTGDVCIVIACGGKGRHRWLWMLNEIEAWAAAEGCKTMRIFGRKGWARVLRDYRVTRFILDKDI